MKTQAFVLFVFFFVLSFTSASCVDSDGGKEYFKYGFVEISDDNMSPNQTVVSGYIRYDECSKLRQEELTEYYCNNGKVDSKEIECEFGCLNGECQKESDCSLKKEVSCEDINGDGISDVVLEGGCDDNIEIMQECELGCGIEDSNWYSDYDDRPIPTCRENHRDAIKCRERGFDFIPSGDGCDKKCRETDHGIDEDKKGGVKGNPSMYKDLNGAKKGSGAYDSYIFDKCKDSKVLIETYCNISNSRNGWFSTIEIECKGSCVDGRCSEYQIGNKEKEEDKDNTSLVLEGIECKNIGDRFDGKYCDEELMHRIQKEEQFECYKDFECKSNVCKDNLCYRPKFLYRVRMWFRNLLF